MASILEQMSKGQSSVWESPSRRSYYCATIGEFLDHHDDTIMAALVNASSFKIELTQRDAWQGQIETMREVLDGWDPEGLIAFEFAVPRMGKRIDVVVVAGSVVFVLEFKVGETAFTTHGLNQVWDYALDMKNFHASSLSATLVPILVSTRATEVPPQSPNSLDPDGVVRPLLASSATLGSVMRMVAERCVGPVLDPTEWLRGSYRPTPNIVEAAMALYGGHQVEEISRREAEAINLTETSSTVDQIIREARAGGHKSICFVTGVPGAGKTLVGLDIATKHIEKSSELYSVFLSGNGPLVSILCEALARDKVARSKESGNPVKIGAARSEVKAFIQNVHHFRDECLQDGERAPIEHVALFDEAQRAWNLEQTASFMRRKKGHADFAMSEPGFLISCMDRHKDWAVVVCLVGGGQEINTGEAGIGEWLRAITADFPEWHVHLSASSRFRVRGRGSAGDAGRP